MTLTFDPADDFGVLDLRRDVLVRNPRDAAGRTVPAVRRSATREDAHASQGRLLTDLGVFHLPAGGDEPEPRLGATLTEADGTEWTVIGLRLEAGGTRRRCTCRKRTVTAEVSELATLYRAVWTQTASGVPVAEWRELRRGVAVRVQPLDDAVARQADAAARRRATHRALLAERLELDDNCRLRAGDALYDVVGLDEQGLIEPGLAVWLELVPGGTSP